MHSIIQTELDLKSEDTFLGSSLAVQWLGLGAFTAGVWVRSLARELRSHKPHSVAKKKDTFLDLILLFASDLALKKSHKLPEAQAFFHL